MGKIQALEEFKLRNYSWVGPKYYDYPDGEDLLGKLRYTTTISGFIGLVAGSVAASRREFLKKPLSAKLLQTARYFIPCLGMGAIFTTVTFFSTKIRQKDDEFNYVLGGLASGTLLGSAHPHIYMGITGALTFAIMGYIKKHHQLRGEIVFPPISRKQFPNYIDRAWNTSLVAPREGNWTKDP